jgi:hypothetical protein
MATFEDLTTHTHVNGVTASGIGTVESAQWIGEQGLKVIYSDAGDELGERCFYRDYRDDEPSLELVERGRPRRRPSGLGIRGVPHQPRVALRSLRCDHHQNFNGVAE